MQYTLERDVYTKCLVLNLDRKRQIGKPWPRWASNFKKCLK